MLADISQTLRDLIYSRAKLESSDVDISFEAPTKEWVNSRTKPAISFFLHDLEENTDLRRTAMELMPVRSVGGNSVGVRRAPPRRFNLHYMVSAISTVVEDEHHLLWRVMSALLKNPTLPEDVVPESVKRLEVDLLGRVSQPDDGPRPIDLWNSLETAPRPALLYVLTVPVDLEAEFTAPLVLTRTEAVGASVGAELYENGALALVVTVLGIMAYLAMRFEWKFAVAGIIANLHDVIIILGFFAFFQWEFSLAVLAAILAVLGYSVNESVVIFDRVRETFRRFRKLTTSQVIDHAITSTTSRTVITHGSTQMMVLSMLIFGGPTLHYFAVALTIGILFGIYSSIFVAAGIAMWLGVKREDLVKVASKEGDPGDPNAGAVV